MNVIALRRKPTPDHHGEMLAKAVSLDTKPFTDAEKELNEHLAKELAREFQRDPEFRRRAEESM